MRSLYALLFALVPLMLIVITPLVAQVRTRDAIPEAYRWNLAELYPDDTAWAAEKERLAADIPQASAFKGTLGDGASQMATALDAQTARVKRFQRLSVYASLAADQDTRVAKNQGLVQQMSQLAAQFATAWAFLEPEILAMDPAMVERFVAQEPRLAPYRQYLRDVLRRKPHTRTEAEEQLIALTGPMTAGASGSASVFLNADLPYPTVKLADGHDVRLDVSAFSAARASANRDDRRKVMEAFFGTLSQFNRTLGAAMNTNVEQALFLTRARRYG